MKSGIVLCSGGVDSVTTAHFVKKRQGYEKLILLFFDYGQKSVGAEREGVKKCAKNLDAEFEEVNLSWLGKISRSKINKGKDFNKISKEDLKDTREESKNWYVPCRNSIFMIHAMAYADSLFISNGEKYDIFVGFKQEGEENYPDTTQKFVEKMNELGKIGSESEIRFFAPLIEKDKEEIVLLGQDLGVDFEETFSCYTGDVHCGRCLACALRKQGFYWAGRDDPTKYLA